MQQDGLVLPDVGRIAVLAARPGGDWTSLSKDQVVACTGSRPDHDMLSAEGWQVVTTPDGTFDAVIVQATRARAETLGLIAQALEHAKAGALVLIDGAKTDGIDALRKQVGQALDLAGTTSKAHGKLLWLHRPKALPKEVANWTAAARLSKNGAGFLTAPGMFSADRADPGSTLLAAYFDQRLSGHAADLGAGWGWLASEALKSGALDHLDLFEADLPSLDAAKKNIDDPRARFHWVDVVGLTADQRYDQVLTNPPFHVGRAAEPALGTAFIATAARILSPQGNLWLVANRQLPYEAALEANFTTWRSLEETPYYKVILASRPITRTARNRRTSPTKSRRIVR